MSVDLTGYPPIPDEARLVFWSMGDANKDGIIDNTDLAMVQAAYGTSNPNCDFNGDGKVDLKDLVIIAKNNGMTIEQFWKNTCDKETMQTQLAQQTGVPNLPWYVDWILPILQQQKTNLEAYAYWQNPAMQALVEGCKGLAAINSDYPLAELEAEQKKQDFYKDSLKEHMSEILSGNMANLPANIVEPTSLLWSDFGKRIHGLQDALNPDSYLAGDGSDIQIYLMAIEMYNTVSDYLKTGDIASTIGSAVTGGYSNAVGDAVSLAKTITGATSIPAMINTMAAKIAITEGLTRYYNNQWTPYTPTKSDWISAYIKGDMTQSDFYHEMRRQGYDEVYSEFLVKDAMNAPSVTDALTAWRRGLITDVDLDLLFKRNRLDPAWKGVFEVRKYNDISLGEAHTLFDLGIADKNKVFDTARRAGYDFDDATALTDSVVNFPIRRLKLRQLLNAVTAYSYGVIDLGGVNSIVTELGYPSSVAVWVQKVGDLKKSILARPKESTTKEKLLSLGDLKAAYLRGLLTEDQFRTELLTRGYNLDDITILISVMTDRRTVEQAGGKMYALSVVELLNAWRYDVITEDALRNKLLARGLPLDELDTLITLKKAQWKITPTTPPPLAGGSGATPV